MLRPESVTLLAAEPGGLLTVVVLASAAYDWLPAASAMLAVEPLPWKNVQSNARVPDRYFSKFQPTVSDVIVEPVLFVIPAMMLRGAA